jgi:hypothetical protein
MLALLGSFYKDNDEDVFTKLHLNEKTGYYEVHYYDSSIKEEPPVGLFTRYTDAISAAKEWTT